jgi:ABC-type amino acid transport substrate-binding protein
MSGLKLMPALLAICFVCLLRTITEAQADDAPILYIGIEKKRIPYTYFDDNQRARGILVAAIDAACQASGLNCKFIGGGFNDNLQALRNIKLNAVVVLDQSLPPDVDTLNLTHPPDITFLKITESLCQIVPTFIQKKSTPVRSTPEDFKNTIIGVQEGSVFHKYLVETNSNQAQLKPYPLLESAIMDLVFDRVDAVLGDAATLNSRVFDSNLDEYAGLIATAFEIPDLPATSMSLALRERDKDRYQQLIAALKAANNNRTCDQLLTDSAKQDKP